VVSVPPHWAAEEEATVSPAGKVSEKATPVRAELPLGLVMMNDRVEVVPTAMGSGAKDLLIDGGRMAVTVRSSEAGAGLLPKSVCRSPARWCWCGCRRWRR